jgi:hypothetical protein
MTLYHVPQSSCCIEIVRIKYRGTDYFKAHIRWYSKPGLKYLFEERNVKIPNKARQFWEIYEV